MIVYLTAILVTLFSLFVFLDSMHMFQLNSYKADIHLKWLRRNLFRVYFGGVKNSGKKAKKPLVYTHRVIRMCVTMAIIYAALVFVIVCFSDFRNLAGLVIMSPLFPIIVNAINSPFEKANNNRYIKEAKRIIDSMPNLITIGITGSYGKTSTKYYLHKLLSAKYETLMTPESYNTTLGVVKTIRNELKPTHEYFVCEMGMMWAGDIAELCKIAKPKHTMITSIGPQHLETMKTQENIIEEKFSITDCVSGKDGGMLFLNFDNGFISERAKKLDSDKAIIRYGVEPDTEAEYKATNISVTEDGTMFTIIAKGENREFITPLIGKHNVQNIIGAIAIAHSMGISLEELALPVKRLECAPHRLELIKKDGLTIIDDTFNSNPVGAKAALETLKLLGGETALKILITPGMVELREKTYELNRQFGVDAADCCDYVVLIGEKQAIPILEGLLEAGFDKTKIKVYNDVNDGMKYATELDSGDKKKVILLENDLPDNY
ncbi:MAG: UDP-N-acetylmuramoyl-tripeptide--D-alanyl-D-alanine ligase [Oscillospiraceae bacterium]|nr:UDP-N-acetylmuramoyl-tripeptide--D-alanyl-D-alanine ligase [Oscillospiraceae bacterium]